MNTDFIDFRKKTYYNDHLINLKQWYTFWLIK